MRRSLRITAAAAALIPVLPLAWAAVQPPQTPAPAAAPSSRIASVYISENLINELLKEYLKTPFLQDVTVGLDSVKDQIIARGLIRVPTDDLRAINIEPGLGDFKFQLAIKLKTTRHGHLLLIFPLDQTFFYPASSTNPNRDRIVIPVQLLSLALASARGYLAMLSGDFSGFDRKTVQLKGQIAAFDRQLASIQDSDERATLENERKNSEIQLQAIPVERLQAEKTAKKMEHILGFVGENEINLNQELSAHRNALILKIKLGQLAPYLQGIELGGVRLLKDERDGSGESFMAVDINAPIAGLVEKEDAPHPPVPHAPQTPPDVLIRLHQAFLESNAVLGAEKNDLGSHIRRFSMDLKDNGIHASGDWHELFFPSIPFDAVVDFVWVSPNVFDIRVREVSVLHIDLKALTRIVLEAAKNRLDKALQGACTFEYVGEEKDRSRAIRVTTNMAALLPAFPKLALTGIRIREKGLVLKAGKI